MAGFDRAKQKLNDLEDRLRRMLGLAGEISASFEPKLTPCVVAGDLRDPGYHEFRGRRWCYAHELNVTGAPNLNLAVQFAVDCLIDCVQVEATVAFTAEAMVMHLTPDQSPGIAVTRPAGVWAELRTISTDQPPLLDSGGAYLNSTIAPSVTNTLLRIGINGPTRLIPVAWHMPAGSFLVFEGTAGAGSMCWGLQGRVF